MHAQSLEHPLCIGIPDSIPESNAGHTNADARGEADARARLMACIIANDGRPAAILGTVRAEPGRVWPSRTWGE